MAICKACGTNSKELINCYGKDICPTCKRYVDVAVKACSTKEDVLNTITHKVDNYYITKPIWNSTLPYKLTKWIGIAIIILMLIERTVN